MSKYIFHGLIVLAVVATACSGMKLRESQADAEARIDNFVLEMTPVLDELAPGGVWETNLINNSDPGTCVTFDVEYRYDFGATESELIEDMEQLVRELQLKGWQVEHEFETSINLDSPSGTPVLVLVSKYSQVGSYLAVIPSAQSDKCFRMERDVELSVAPLPDDSESGID